ncbi:MAG: ribonucleoside triphosphate reductase [Endomicrobia bacterium]|nr:ribonucleoside triphosphate reductase [Endomicrobiia bacterium]MDW8056359.1 ribonucleoside triphosphate reductase [Elusimicrobiota bacterium]
MEKTIIVSSIFKHIIKRDGRIVDFDASKITNAILKAGIATGEFGEEVARSLTIKVLNLAQQLELSDTPTVEQIQDIVEEVLLTSPFKKTAKAYILYRQQRKEIREISSKFSVELIDKYLNKYDWQVKENSNMSFSLQGLNNYISQELTKIYWLNKIYTEDIKSAHLDGDFHIHDLGVLSVYCVGWDLQDLLTVGFRGAKDKVESNPPKHFRSALGQIVNFFYTLQGEAAGAQAFSNFDTLLAPFIKYDNLSYQSVKQAIQEFVFNLNVPTRVGFQTPFTNLTFDLIPPEHLKNQNVIVSGEVKEEKYGDFQCEMNMINKAFLEVMFEGDAKGRVFTFPIPTYNITKNFDYENESLELLWKITGKYGVPYFANFVNSDMKPEDTRSMCCRLRLDNRELNRRLGGLFSSSPLTGSIGVVTINMPRIGYLSKTEKEFFDRLSFIMDLAKNSLETKRKVLEKLTDNDLYPYSKFYLREIKKRFGEYWKNHFSTIGLVGMNEALINFLGVDIGNKDGIEFTLKVLDFMRSKLDEYQKETTNLYNLEATPAESTSYRLALLDKKKYPDLLISYNKKIREVEHPVYTNSTQLPVNYTDDIFELLELQNDIQKKYTGGTVVHIFVGEEIEDSKSVKKLVKKVTQSFEVPYFTITPTFSVCPNCGYIKGEKQICPKCSELCEVYSRVVGYLRPLSKWNEGKQSEFKQRKAFRINT